MLNALILVPLAILILLNLPLGGWLKKASFYATLALALVQAWFVVFPAPLLSIAGNACPFFPFPIGLDSLTLIMLLSIAIVVFAALLTGLVDDKRSPISALISRTFLSFPLSA